LPATQHALDLTRAAAEAAADKLGERQVGAVVDGIEEALRSQDAKPVRREGAREQRWVLLDYLDLVVHVQHTEERQFYALERLWRDCPEIALGVDERR
jgi:ribosome-associated protein